MEQRSAIAVGSTPRTSHGFWVATPVGQPPVWHFCAWMHPTDSMASRATLIMSTPSASATTAFSGMPSLPAPMNTTSSVSPASAKTEYTRGKPRRKGKDTASVNTSGPAPVPPSPPSIVMKSTPRSRGTIAVASSSQKVMSPMADLMPTGRPVRSAMSSTRSSIESTSLNAVCREGLAQSSPIGIPRIAAISSLILAAGRSPPRPGLAPWESLISIARIGCFSVSATSLSMSNRPRSSRTPK